MGDKKAAPKGGTVDLMTSQEVAAEIINVAKVSGETVDELVKRYETINPDYANELKNLLSFPQAF